MEKRQMPLGKTALNPYAKDNERFLDVVNAELVKNNFENVRYLLNNITNYTKCPFLYDRTKGLFIKDKRCQKLYGISANVNQATVNMVFAGEVKIKLDENLGDEAQRLVDDFVEQSNFIDKMKEGYSAALACSGEAKSYFFFKTSSQYNLFTGYKVGEEFVEIEVLPKYEVEYDGNVFNRGVFKEVQALDDNGKPAIKTYQFIYSYSIYPKNNEAVLEIKGYDEKGNLIDDERTKNYLGLDTLVFVYDFIPVFELNVGRGQLPNGLFIEDSLAKNLYYEDLDLANSQTQKYIPHDLTYLAPFADDKQVPIDDIYSTTHILKRSPEHSEITIVAGESSVGALKEHRILKTIQAAMDGSISVLSLGDPLIEKLVSQSDNATTKERISIRKRESDISSLEAEMAAIIKTFLHINGISAEPKQVSVIFDDYITPSFESQINTYSKAVQFGVASREYAIDVLYADKLSQAEREKMKQDIRNFTTQRDYGVSESVGGTGGRGNPNPSALDRVDDNFEKLAKQDQALPGVDNKLKSID